MPSLKAIRKRILSVQNTAKITRAMKMVAASKLRRAQEQIVAARPYAFRLGEMIQRLSRETGSTHPLMVPRESVRRVALIILTSDRGLCGAFNANIIKKAERFLRTEGSRLDAVLLLPVGRKAIDFFRSRPVTVHRSWRDALGKVAYDTAEEIAAEACSLFERGGEAGGVDEVYVVYNEFKSAISQRVVAERLLPIAEVVPGDEATAEWLSSAAPAASRVDDGGRDAHAHDDREHLYEPGREELLGQLVPRHTVTQILRCLFESSASEHGARMSAMEAATNNASEMIGALTLTYNRARQAAITKELIEVVSGAEAL